jgi:hypothetical protein
MVAAICRCDVDQLHRKPLDPGHLAAVGKPLVAAG